MATLLACTSDPTAPVTCPQVQVINGLETATYYNPPDQDRLENLTLSLALENIQGACSYGDNFVDLSVSIDIIARFGPAFAQDAIDVPYFVAVEDTEGNLIFKRTFETSIDPPSGVKSAGNREFFDQQVFNVTPETGPAYRVFFGLEIGRDLAIENIQGS